MNLNIKEIKAFIPSKDYELSKEFYKELGFIQASDVDGVSYFYLKNCSFLLQDYYTKDFCDNFMMHFLVEDIYVWYKSIKDKGLIEKYDIKMTEIKEQPWKMYEFCLYDPSGVLLRIAQCI